MTDHHDLKAQIRERMASSGETYTTARRHVLAAASHTEVPVDCFLLGRDYSTQGMDLVIIGSPKSSTVLLPNLKASQGPCLIVATPDSFRETCGLRSRLGPVLVFDPRDDLKTLSDEKGYKRLSFSPFADCFVLDPETGEKRPDWDECWKAAMWLSQGLAPRGRESQDWEYWASSARQLLSGYLYAVSLAGLSMKEIYGWITAHDISKAVAIIEDASKAGTLPLFDTNTSINMLKGIDGRPDRERGTVFSTVATLMGIFSESAVIRSTLTSNFTLDELLVPGTTTYLIRSPWRHSGTDLVTAFFDHVLLKVCGKSRPTTSSLRVFLPSQDSLPLELLANNRSEIRFFVQINDVASLVENGGGKLLKQILQQHEVLLIPGSMTSGSLAEILSDLPLDRLPRISPEAYDNYLIPLEGHPRVINLN